MRPTVTLYTRPGCHLCEEVKIALVQLQGLFPHTLVEIDITADPALLRRYHLTIPVVQIGDVTLEAPITSGQLVQALRRDYS